jgi:hypothetical protein
MTLGIIRLGLKQRGLKRQKSEASIRQDQWERRKGSRLPCTGNSAARAQRREAYEDKIADLESESASVEAELLENLTAIPEAEMQILKSLYPAPFLKYITVFVAYHIADDCEDGTSVSVCCYWVFFVVVYLSMSILYVCTTHTHTHTHTGLTAVEEWKRAVRVNTQEVLSQPIIYTAQGQLLHQAASRFAHTTKRDTEFDEHGKVSFRVEMVQETDSKLCMHCMYCVRHMCVSRVASCHVYVYIFTYIVCTHSHTHNRLHGGRLLLRGAKRKGRRRKN